MILYYTNFCVQVYLCIALQVEDSFTFIYKNIAIQNIRCTCKNTLLFFVHFYNTKRIKNLHVFMFNRKWCSYKFYFVYFNIVIVDFIIYYLQQTNFVCKQKHNFWIYQQFVYVLKLKWYGIC